MPSDFRIVALTPPGLGDPAIAIAASRAGALGVLDLEHVRDDASALGMLARLARFAPGDCGVRMDGGDPARVGRIAGTLPETVRTAVLASADDEALRASIGHLRTAGMHVVLEVTSEDEARRGEALGVDVLIAKGHEAGGRVGEETTFVLLQRLLARTRLPVWAQGGIGPHTAAACYAAGAAGVVLDAQLALTRESTLPEPVRAAIARMDGSETVCLDGGTAGFRVFHRPGLAPVEALRKLEGDAFWNEVRERVGCESPDRSLLVLGQDAAFAAPLAERFRTVGGVIGGMRAAVDAHVRAARRLRPLDEGSPLAESHGTRYPIVQGPMTRVSDTAAFADAVAAGGALPFLALAMMRAPEVEALLHETRDRLGDRPWGVGILGFVPPELREEQLAVVRAVRPRFALIAGGRPDQALALEESGITTYLHVPSPGLLRQFVESGARRFVFEGRECGGHVGPRSSFVLWETMLDVLLSLPSATVEGCHVLFAGGVHDDVSAAMVAAMAAPLAERGARTGVLVGTAYLFTEEAVAAGAVTPVFQQEAVRCESTVLLESGPGHATRCVPTAFAETFGRERRRLLAEGGATEAVRDALEQLNLGRLRIATKGMDRHPRHGIDPAAPRLMPVSEEEQFERGMFMIGQVAALRDRVVTVAGLHRQIAAGSAARLAALADPSLAPVPGPREERPFDVAIVGMACILPGAADLRAYWENILDRVDAVTEVPEHRWDWRRYYDPDPAARDRIYSRWGGFIDDVAFDPMRYGMPPSTLSSIEPLQLLTLEVVRAALQDAGYLDRSFPRQRASAILGAGGGVAALGNRYAVRSALPLVLEEVPEEAFAGLPEWTEDSFPGILLNVAAGRVANRFDLGGVNYVVDAACASSLAALHLAVRELEAGTSDLVIAGGVEAVQDPFGFLAFSKTHALSPRGRCRPFDESADGIAISEGLAMVVLKRVEDAERDGDRIYAVIRGVAGSSDGRDRGLTAPRPEGQAAALERAYAKAGFSPATVGLMEAHGTGTVVGDQTEVATLSRVLSEAGAPLQGCALGSVKSMIGHTKAAAGMAGLIKTALALHHQVLPPTLHVETPNPRARFGESPLYPNTEPRPWVHSKDWPRRAGVSAFGFGGTNFHAVLEEYTGDFLPSAHAAVARRWPAELLLFTGESAVQIRASLLALAAELERGARPRLPDLAWSLWKRAARKPGLTLSLVAMSVDGLRGELLRAAEMLSGDVDSVQDPRGICFAANPLGREGKVAFLFPGQGSQYPGMLADLAVHFPEVRARFERADGVLADRFGEGLSSIVFPPPAFTPEEKQARQAALTRTDAAQPALGAAGLGMHHLLAALGIRPDMTAGHSYGEYVALCAAGVFGEDALYRLSEARGRSIIEAAEGDLGTMAAVPVERSVVEALAREMEGVWIANLNAPRQTVLSGTREGIARAVERLAAEGIEARPLPVACAFHSPLVAPARDRLAAVLAGEAYQAPRVPVFSNATAEPYPSDAAGIAAVLAEHLVSPVRFVDQVAAMYEAGARVFVEAGPRGMLTGLAEQTLQGRPFLALATDASAAVGRVQLLRALGQLAAHAVPMDLGRLFTGRDVRLLDLDRLAEDTRERPLPPTTWLVNGGQARPLSQPPVPMAPVPLPKREAPAPAVASSAPTPIATTAPAAPPAAPPAPAATPAAAEAPRQVSVPAIFPSDATDAVMLQFQRLMSGFLETQQQVMRAYLTGAAPAPSAVVPQTQTHAVLPPAQPPVPAPAAPPALSANGSAAAHHPPETNGATPPAPSTNGASAAPAEPALDRETVTRRLLDLVAERTGYPPEMLDLDLNLEADLGIDSIKRVEILGAFQRACLPPGQHGRGLMDRLSGLKTLRAIADATFGLIEESAVPTASANGAAASNGKPASNGASAPADRETVTRRLLDLVAERTGYPPEMLDLDLNLEADLGIDSIKRVEILGAFQRACLPPGQHGRGLMDRLSGLKTLRAIADATFGLIEESAAPAASPNGSAAPASNGKPSSNGASAPADRETVTRRLLELVAERTGYPPEMLDLDLNLEADLGIDSIKRVEILGAFQRTSLPAGQHGRGAMDRLTTLKTLRGVVDATMSLLAEDAAPPAAPSAPAMEAAPPIPRSAPAPEVPRFRLVAVDAPAEPAFAPLQPPGALVLTDDGGGVADALAAELREQGVRVAVLRMDGAEPVDLADAASVAAALARVRDREGPIAGVVHLLPLAAGPAFEALDFDAWKARVEREVRGLYLLARDAGPELRRAGDAGGGWLVAATRMGGAFGLGASQPFLPGQGGVAGFVKTVAIEWPQVRCKVVDLDDAAPAAAAARLLAELRAGDEVMVGWQGARRLTVRAEAAPLPESAGPPPLDADSVVLLTGGARGITAEVALELARRYRPTLVLVGRAELPDAAESPATAGMEAPRELKAALMEEMRRAGQEVTPARVEAAYATLLREREIRATLAALRQAGATVHYHAADVRDPRAFGELIDRLYATHGRLDGVIHGAGIIEDRLVDDKTPESFDRVFQTKVLSAFTLSRHLRPESLKFLAFFASVAGSFGNRGQADYAAANEVLNKLALHLDGRWPGRVSALNWGPWLKVGMVSPEIERQFAERGVQVIDPVAGREALERELRLGAPGEVEVVLGAGPWAAGEALRSPAALFAR